MFYLINLEEKKIFIKLIYLIPGGQSPPGIREEILEKLVPHISNYPLLGHKELQYPIWLEIVKILSLETTRFFERDNKIDNLINKLSNL